VNPNQKSKIKNQKSSSPLRILLNEIYVSLQGESTFAGLPCIFIRLAACNLRCSYCDTAYAFTGGNNKTLEEILAQVRALASPFAFARQHEGKSKFEIRNSKISAAQSKIKNQKSKIPLPLIELTGGEPLLQKNCLPLMAMLCDDGFTVLLETSGALDISPVDRRVRRIMDLKCPSSGEVARNRLANIGELKSTDEIKFVIGTREDYAWAREIIALHKLAAICPLLFSWVHPLAPEQQDKSLKKVPLGQTPISRQELAERIIADALPVRFQVQLHKVIWPPEQRGV